MKMKVLRAVCILSVFCCVGLFFLLRSNETSVPTLPAAPVKAVDAASDIPNPSVPLIRTSEETDYNWTSRNPAAKRIRRIFPDLSWMTSTPVLKVGDEIKLALFDDAVFDAKISNVTPYSNGAVGMTAHLPDGKGTVYLSYCGGELSASVEVIGGPDYAVKNINGVHYALEVDRAKSIVLEGGDSLAPDIFVDEPSGNKTLISGDLPADAPAGSTVVDVMIVYSPAALSYEGSLAAMNNNIAQAMQKANEALTNSDTRIYLNLVHSAEVTYTESGDSSTDLSRLKLTDDGYLDEVHALRDAYGADLVCLYLVLNDVGGQGYLLDNTEGLPDWAFCIARVQQSDWTYTVVHEWGHNMGCHHSKSQAVQAGPTAWDNWSENTWSAGWQWADTRSAGEIGYCSIMTYEDIDNDDTYEYERVAYFSNPSINYIGSLTNATGDAADGDNARTLRTTRFIVEGYRAGAHPINEFPYTTSFEQGFIEWQPSNGEAPWEREDGTDPNLQSAVSSGWSGTTNAYDGNIFLFVDASQYAGSSADLEASFDFSGLSDASVSFFYHMNSLFPSFMGSLSLQVSTNSGTTWTALWSRTGGQENSWQEGSVNLGKYAGVSNVYLRFQAQLESMADFNYICLDLISVTGTGTSVSDTDNDGLPNAWELQYFGGETNAVPSDDSDGDGFSNLEEYISGFNPTNASSFFSMTNSVPTENGFVVWWNAVSGRVYSVNWATNLLSGFQPLETNIFWPQSSYTDTVHGTEADGFYRVGVELEQ